MLSVVPQQAVLDQNCVVDAWIEDMLIAYGLPGSHIPGSLSNRLPTLYIYQSVWQGKETPSASKVGFKYGSDIATSPSSVYSKAKCEKDVVGKGPLQGEVGYT